jgi:uncharacterized phiE125 gp8 family phage protein
MPRTIRLEQTTPPTDLPVTVDEAKAFLRIDHTAEDALIESLVAAARDVVENYLRRSVCTQTWTLVLDSLAEQAFLPRPPVTDITSVEVDGLVADAGDYENDADRLIVLNGSLLDGEAKVVYQAGDSTNIPDYAKLAVMQIIAYWYENRQGQSVPAEYAAQATGIGLPPAVKALLAPHKVMWL